MLQSFETHADSETGAPRLKLLRAQMQKHKLDAFLVPHEDAFMGEYVPPHGARLKWLTGFDGSAGAAVVLTKSAALFVDGRYVLQAPRQVDTNCFDIIPLTQTHIKDWLKEQLPNGAVIGFDPFLHSIKQHNDMAEMLKENNISLKPITPNLLDTIWHDQPPLPQQPVSLHPDARAGQTSRAKREKLCKAIDEKKCAAFLFTRPESIAWALNIRGADVPHTPFALSYALLHKNGAVDWFIAPERVAKSVLTHIGGEVNLIPPEKMQAHLRQHKNARIGLDESTANYIFADWLPDAVNMADPSSLPKACKSQAEIDGAIAAHKRDGVALCRFLCWFDTHAPKGKETEISAAQKLEAFRVQADELLDLSFDTISASGANGAIVHYRVTKATDRKIQAGDIYLVDSGGQYQDGTTDVTRTIWVTGAPPPDDAIMAFTRVLKGHIALAAARFPKDTNGIALDALARAPLWAGGLDFDHGTGHGVGSYLSVHEGPQSISRNGTAALKEGMIVSNEPGYYREGAFGIRIENLQYVTPLTLRAGEAEEMHSFAPLTMAPIDRRLIDTKLLTQDEQAWLNNYHQMVLANLSALLDAQTRKWLVAACAPLG